jgi:putative transposase
MGIREILTAPRKPWQNPFVERVIGSIRRECLISAALLRAYVTYYNTTRPHQSLDNHSPQPRVIDPSPCGRIIAMPQVGGLHHRYQRAA